MYIKRTTWFSDYDETGEERLYSLSEFEEVMSEEDYLEKLYSVGFIKNTIRKIGREGRTAKTVFKAAVGKDLTNAEIGTLAARAKLGAAKKGITDSKIQKAVDILERNYKSGAKGISLGSGNYRFVK